jgi:hypothetical protein
MRRSTRGCRSAAGRSTAPTVRSSASAPSRIGPRCPRCRTSRIWWCGKHLRRVGKDCLISFEASCYSVPARSIRPGQRVQLQIHPDPADGDRVSIHALAVDGGGWLATHPRATRRGEWVIDPAHWSGLPDGHTRATTTEPVPTVHPSRPRRLEPLSALLTRRHADLTVAARPLTDYARLTNYAAGDAAHLKENH